MCQILSISGSIPGHSDKKLAKEKLINTLFSIEQSVLPLSTINNYMEIKGSTDFSVSALFVLNGMYYLSTDFFYDIERGTFEHLVTQNINEANDRNDYFDLCLFRRMAPETENSTSRPQPYYNNYNQTIYFVHGLISNVEELCEKYDITVPKVDTDIFALLPIIDFNEIQGKYVAFMYDTQKNKHEIYNSGGLGVWRIDSAAFHLNTMVDAGVKINHVIGTSALTPEYRNNRFINNPVIDKKITLPLEMYAQREHSKRIAIALYSGGLDITAAVLAYKKINPDVQEVIGLYFDWGTAAAEMEKQAGNRAYEKGILDRYEIIPIDWYPKIAKYFGQKSKLTDANATGQGIQEAESSSIAYAPYRNTILLTLAAMYAEGRYKEQLENNSIGVDFIIGANLSEGMVFNDNTEIFIETIKDTLKLGGNEKYDFEVVSPFVNKTKTEMLRSFDDDEFNLIIEVSASCYYPDENGNPCGKCGSCLLRQQAIERRKGANDGNPNTIER